jgi:hypothetical protein
MTRFVLLDEYQGHKFEWELKLRPSHTPNPPKVTCTSCHGSCRPHFGMIDDPVDCWHCNNTGTIPDPNYKFDPPPPPELVEALRKVWKDHWNKVENEKFTLTMQ